jgi:PAS domain S-box-containing protein
MTINLEQHTTELKAGGERFEFLTNAMPSIVWTSQSDGGISYFNQCWLDYTGMAFEDSEGWGWQQAVHPDDLQTYLDQWNHACTTGANFEIQFRLRRNVDGAYRWHLARAVPYRNPDGVIVEWVGTSTDIDDYARTMERFEAAIGELDAFAYTISHDLRAPLRSIDGFVQILEQEYAPNIPPEAQRLFQRVLANTQKMSNLIDDLLVFSRLGRRSITLKPVNVARLVNEVWDDLSSERAGRKIEFVIADLPPCTADHTLLSQVFVNLLGNAIKYTRDREPAIIEVSAHEDRVNGEIVYQIKDNGVGFDVRYADKLFGVFQRLHRAEDYEGTGAGLAIVKRIVNRFHGRVWADSVLDQGATFSFALPDIGVPEESNSTAATGIEETS